VQGVRPLAQAPDARGLAPCDDRLRRSAAGMKDGEFELLTKPYTIEAVAEALGRTTL
jgi:hypothetical protein